MKKHTDFSPSSFERRYLCAASYLMEKDLPPTTSKYAEEGTILHELVTNDIREYLRLEQEQIYPFGSYLHYLENVKHVENKHKYLITDCLNSFIKLKASLNNSEVILDKRFDLPFIADNERGTVDLIVTGYNEDNRYQVHVVDFKFGFGVHVLAENNLQLLCYAKGYIQSKYHNIKDYDLHLHIFQPTFSNSCWSLDEEEKYKWIISDNFYKNVVRKCKVLEPEFNPSVKACKFCKAKSICKSLSTKVSIKDKYSLTIDEIRDFLDRKELIMIYMDSLEDFAKTILENGGHISGYTLVDKYSNRKWIEGANSELELLLGDEAYVIKKNIIGIGQAEKLLSKEQISKLTEKELIGKVLQKQEDKLKDLN